MSKVRFSASVGRGPEHRARSRGQQREGYGQGPAEAIRPIGRCGTGAELVRLARTRWRQTAATRSPRSHPSGTMRPAPPNAARHDTRRVCAASSNLK